MNEVIISYIIDSPEMTDDEFQNQESKKFIITENDIEDIIKQKILIEGQIQIEEIKIRKENY